MRKVDRTSVDAPQKLVGRRSRGKKEILRAAKHFKENKKIAGFTFSAYKDEQCKKALRQLFHNKCAYCESRYDAVTPDDIDHYRPKGKVDELDDHPGYWWLGADWDNLLPSCPDCNRRRRQHTPVASPALLTNVPTDGVEIISTGKDASFPIEGRRVMSARDGPLSDEKPLLLNPCEDIDIDKHIRFHIDPARHLGCVLACWTGETDEHAELPEATDDWSAVECAALAAGVSVRGAVSIQTYGLNRIGLLQARLRLLLELEFLGELLITNADAHRKVVTVKNNFAGETQTENTRYLDEIAVMLAAQQSAILKVISGKAKPEAPYSNMVQSWIKNFLDRTGLIVACP